MSNKLIPACCAVVVALVSASLVSCSARAPLDEAKRAGKTPADFPQDAYDYFYGMDGGVELTPDEVRGRNTWLMWTAGNAGFWNFLAGNSFGNLDLLKTLSSYPDPTLYPYSRENRFDYFGVMNEPGFEEATEPGPYGLWLDERVRSTKEPDPEIYGRASGIVGLRLFDNPDFDEDARAHWDAERFYTDRDYFLDPELVRPLRVGVSCAFCHIGPNPLAPPPDPNEPEFAHMSSTIGAQHFWFGRVFFSQPDEENFIWQMLQANPPGALDTSFIATDNIFNPRTINSIYEVAARLTRVEKERLGKNNLAVIGTPDVVGDFETPHILKDGSDSVGILGALARVYLNIGEYHEEWLRHFNLLVGGTRQTPFDVNVAQEKSTYWLASEERVANLAAFLTRAGSPHRLADAPDGRSYLTESDDIVTRGKLVFADACAQCHSSKQPPGDLRPDLPAYQEWMRAEVLKTDFLDDNYLSDDRRYRISDIGTNACATLATNALRGHVWDSFSSETFKTLPTAGDVQVWHPTEGTLYDYSMPGGGRGYVRTPTLVGLWASAPFFQNNALGLFNGDPSVEGRMTAFDDAVLKLLWPERRLSPEASESELAESSYCHQRWGLPFCSPVYRTTRTSYLKLHRYFLPKILHGPLLRGEDELRLGPIPKGTPIALIANLNVELSFDPPGRLGNLVTVILKLKGVLERIEDEGLDEEQARALYREVVPELLEVNKCPDFVVNRGHDYGAELSDADKRALISFLKRM